MLAAKIFTVNDDGDQEVAGFFAFENGGIVPHPEPGNEQLFRTILEEFPPEEQPVAWLRKLHTIMDGAYRRAGKVETI